MIPLDLFLPVGVSICKLSFTSKSTELVELVEAQFESVKRAGTSEKGAKKTRY